MSYGFIFTDFSMPVLNGIDATIQIKKYFKEKKVSRSKQPIIIGLTGHVQQSFQKEGIDAGMNIVRSKPFLSKNLKEIV